MEKALTALLAAHPAPATSNNSPSTTQIPRSWPLALLHARVSESFRTVCLKSAHRGNASKI